tara:strand:- start:370 stop:747 length:378 start_codon:yes stop_codon:yes gene_type:complete
MSLDVREIAQKKNSEDDGGVTLGSEQSRLHLGDSGLRMRSRDFTGEGAESTLELNKEGVSLTGANITLDASLENIFLGGGFSFNPELMTGIPSTLTTPIPVLKATPFSSMRPLLDKAKNIGKLFQ